MSETPPFKLICLSQEAIKKEPDIIDDVEFTKKKESTIKHEDGIYEFNVEATIEQKTIKEEPKYMDDIEAMIKQEATQKEPGDLENIKTQETIKKEADDTGYLEYRLKEEELDIPECVRICESDGNHQETFYCNLSSSDVKITMYKCNLCKYQTNQKLYFKRHEKRHLSGARLSAGQHKTNTVLDPLKSPHQSVKESTPYKCEVCQFETNFKTQMKRHEKTQLHKLFVYNKKYTPAIWVIRG